MKFSRHALPILCGALALCLPGASLEAQDKAAPNGNPPPAKPGGDPFVKKKGGAPAAGAAAPAPQELQTLAITQEVVALSLEDYHRLVETTADSGQLYQEIEKLKSAGQAKLETLMEATTHSGQRVAGEQVDEVRYATQFNPPQTPDGFPFPTGYEMRPVGQKWEVDPVISPDGRITDLSLSAPNTRLSEFSELRADLNALGILQPKFETREIAAAVTVHHNRPQLAGTISRSTTAEGAADNRVRLLFLRVVPVEVGAPAKSWLPDPDVGANLRFTATLFSMEQATALTMLRNAGDPEAVHVAVMEQVRGQKAKLERVISCMTRSGQRTQAKEIEEFRNGTELNPPQVDMERNGKGEWSIIPTGKTIPPFWTAFETRELGWKLEVDPVLQETGIVDVNVALDRTAFIGWLQGHEWLEKRDPPLPVFETRKITTSLSTAVGKHALMGTFSPPHDTNVNGRKDDGRIWLAFLKVTVD